MLEPCIWGFCHIEYNLIPPPSRTATPVDNRASPIQLGKIRRQAFNRVTIEWEQPTTLSLASLRQLCKYSLYVTGPAVPLQPIK